MTLISPFLFIIFFSFSIGHNAFAQNELLIVTNDYPPYITETTDPSCLKEIFNKIAKEMGVKFVYKFIPWPRCEKAVLNLNAWATIPYVKTIEREKNFYFSDKIYTRQSKFFYYSADGMPRDIEFNALSDLKEYTIGGVIGYYYINMFKEAGLKLEIVDAEVQNFRKMAAGRIDMAPSDEAVGWYLIKKHFPDKMNRFFTISRPFTISDNYLMTAKNYPNVEELVGSFNMAMQKVKQDGVFQQIFEKYNILVLNF